MRLPGLPAAAMVLSAALATPAAAAAPVYGPVVEVIEAFATPGRLPGSEDLDALRRARWAPEGIVLLEELTPDGNSFARNGTIAAGRRLLGISVTGARAGIFSVYLSDTRAAAPANSVARGLREAGLPLVEARCPRSAAAADPYRGWYRLGTKKGQGALHLHRLDPDRQGYVFYLTDLPLMTQEEASRFIACTNGRPDAAALAAPQTGQSGLVAAIEALLRPSGTPAHVAWRTPLPGVSWSANGPMKVASAYSASGVDENPYSLSGRFETPTTEMFVQATGDAQAANRFHFENGAHLPRDAVFDGLRRDGYSITAVICGKPYTMMSENWYRLVARGKQPAILYRVMSVSTGRPTEGYALRLDDTLPPLQPGQRLAGKGACPGDRTVTGAVHTRRPTRAQGLPPGTIPATRRVWQRRAAPARRRPASR